MLVWQTLIRASAFAGLLAGCATTVTQDPRGTTIDDDDERLRLHDAVSDLCQYINSLSTPRRNATFADLHSLHSV